MTDFASLTRAPRLKIERAKQHINDLDVRVKALADRGLIYVSVTEHMTRNQIVVQAKASKAIPEDLSLIVGDAIHNLRTALDLLIFAMIGDRAKDPEAVQFPFAKRRETFEAAMQRREIKLAGEKVVDKIRTLEPYRDGNKFLAGLHLLDVQDKHRLLVPVAQSWGISVRQILSIAPRTAISAEPGYEDGIAIQGTAGSVTLPGPPAWGWTGSAVGYPSSVEHKTKVRIPATIGFAEGEFFNSEPVVGKLNEITAFVSEVVDDLSHTFIDSGIA